MTRYLVYSAGYTIMLFRLLNAHRLLCSTYKSIQIWIVDFSVLGYHSQTSTSQRRASLLLHQAVHGVSKKNDDNILHKFYTPIKLARLELIVSLCGSLSGITGQGCLALALGQVKRVSSVLLNE